MHTVAPPLPPRASLRDRIVNLRREIAGLRSDSRTVVWVARAERDLSALESELTAMERPRR